MAVEFWTRRQPVTFYPSKGKGRNNPFSFENFKTFVGYLSHTVAFAFGTRAVDKKERYIIVSEEDLKDFNELEKIIVKIGKKNASIRNPSGLRDSAIKTIVSWKTKDNESCLLLFDINGNLLTYSQSIIEDKEAIKLSTKLLLFIALSQSNHDIGTDGMDRGHR